jgi:hypothetical protein
MTAVHLSVGIAVVAANLIAAAWGGIEYWRGRASVAFWYALRTAQALVIAQVLLGAILLMLGHEPADELHYVYGALPLLVTFLAEGARVGVADRELEGLDFEALPKPRQGEIALLIARRQMGMLALSAAVIFGLTLRAAFVSGGI